MRKDGLLAVMVVVAGLSIAAVAQQKPVSENTNTGANLYREFCAPCHGDRGAGDGPVADITHGRPSDLTRLSAQNGGEYPRARVLSAFDGTRPMPAHGVTGMPKWHDVFRRLADGNERRAQDAMTAIVSHIETLQRNN